MQAEAPPSPAPRRGNAGRLERALIALAGGEGRVLDHRERGWASITFAGTRHTVQLAFETPEAIAGGEVLIAELPDHEFAIPGQLVADAGVVEVEHRLTPEPWLIVRCELLLLEES